MIDGLVDILNKLYNSWHKPIGLFIGCILAFAITRYISIDLLGLTIPTKCVIFLYGSILLAIYIFWLFSSNRIIYRGENDLVICILPTADELSEASNVFTISKNCVKNVRKSFGLEAVKIINLPPNYLEGTARLKKYMENNKRNLDCILILHIHTGNLNNDQKINIEKLEFYYNEETLPTQKSVLLEKIDFINEIKIQNFHKKWAVLNSNSFEDRAIVKENFEDLLKHSIAIQYLLKGSHEKSLEILERILQTEKLRVKINHENPTEINFSPELVSQSRIFHLIATLNIYLSDKYIYSDPAKTLYFLQKLENYGYHHKYSCAQLIRMARMFYECGDMENAIAYTNKAEHINKKEMAINMNRVFFGILQQNWNLIHDNIKIIFHEKNKIQNGTIDVIAFLEREKKKIGRFEIEFDFVINVYQTMFTDKSIGRENLIKIIKIMNESGVPAKVIYLGNKIARCK